MFGVGLSFVLGNWKAFMIGAAAIAVGVVVVHYRDKWIDEGKAEREKQIEDANHENDVRADAASKNIADCYAHGPDWTWDRVRGVCAKSIASP